MTVSKQGGATTSVHHHRSTTHYLTIEVPPIAGLEQSEEVILDLIIGDRTKRVRLNLTEIERMIRHAESRY